MKIIETPHPDAFQQKAICELWNNEYPEKLMHPSVESFRRYLDELHHQQHFLLIDDNNSITGWAFLFVRDKEKWFAIIVDRNAQGGGFGGRLLNRLKENATKLNGWVVDHSYNKKKNGENYVSPLPFYLKKGFRTCQGERLELEKFSAVKIEWEDEPF